MSYSQAELAHIDLYDICIMLSQLLLINTDYDLMILVVLNSRWSTGLLVVTLFDQKMVCL